MSSLRGYFQGHFDMVPTSLSQIVEAFFKMVVGLGLAVFIASLNIQDPNIPDLGERLPAVGAILGVSTGSAVALVYLSVVYFRRRRGALPTPPARAASSSGTCCCWPSPSPWAPGPTPSSPW